MNRSKCLQFKSSRYVFLHRKSIGTFRNQKVMKKRANLSKKDELRAVAVVVDM